jgi:hypothetical protein
VCGINVEIIDISEIYKVPVGSFFFICRPYHSIPTVIFDQVVTEGNISLLFNDGVENCRYFALLFVEQSERLGIF